MIDFDDLRRDIDAREEWFVELLRARRARAALPVRALGRFETIAEWFAAARRSQDVRDLARARLIVFAAEHGIAEADISGHPKDASRRLADEIESGTGPIAALADGAGAGVRVVRVGDGPSRRIDRADALTEEEFDAAVTRGVEVANEEVDGGADLLMVAASGVAVSAPAATIVGVILRADPSSVTGRGSGIEDAGWMRKVVVIRDAMRRGRRFYAEPAELLRTAGGADLAAMVGFLMQAGVRRTPVLLDGVAASAAALLARDIAWSATNWWLASCTGEEPAHRKALEAMTLEPLLDADIRIGGGAAALAALPVLRAALRSVGAALEGVEPEPETTEEAADDPVPESDPAANEGSDELTGADPAGDADQESPDAHWHRFDDLPGAGADQPSDATAVELTATDASATDASTNPESAPGQPESAAPSEKSVSRPDE
ncbi:MAG: nicotinate-nucleotide--dimethylbenzimidazole phosphoribosyltransferase [Mycobacteriales bacterium]